MFFGYFDFGLIVDGVEENQHSILGFCFLKYSCKSRKRPLLDRYFVPGIETIRFYINISVFEPGLNLSDDMIVHDARTPRWITDDAFDASRVGNQMIILRGSESGEKIAGEKMFRLFLQLAAAKTAASQFGLKHFNIRQSQELTADYSLHFRLGVNAVPILHDLVGCATAISCHPDSFGCIY
jgi:hypothetical protein